VTRKAGNLSRDAIKALKRGASITDGGITAQRLANGDVRWTVGIMVAGRRIHRVVGKTSEGVGRADSEAFIERVRSDERADRLQLPAGRKTWLSFAQAADRYLERMESSGGKNLKAKEQHIRMWLKPAFGAQRADTLSAFTVATYAKKRLKAGAEPGTINRELATLKHFLNDAVAAKDLKTVPCKLDMLKEGEGRTVVLSEDEAEALMQAAIADQDGDLWLFVAFALNTAMRHREVLRARFDQVAWDRARLYIGKAKAGAREQPLTPALVDILREERDHRNDRDGYIFPAKSSQAKHPHRDRITAGFKRVVIRAGLEPAKVTPHVLRHTAITRLVEAGVDLPTIQRISGHKTLAMVARYAHVSSPHIDVAMGALDRTIPEPVRNGTSTQVTQELHRRRAK
jgi:integrase